MRADEVVQQEKERERGQESPVEVVEGFPIGKLMLLSRVSHILTRSSTQSIPCWNSEADDKRKRPLNSVNMKDVAHRTSFSITPELSVNASRHRPNSKRRAGKRHPKDCRRQSVANGTGTHQSESTVEVGCGRYGRSQHEKGCRSAKPAFSQRGTSGEVGQTDGTDASQRRNTLCLPRRNRSQQVRTSHSDFRSVNRPSISISIIEPT
jgi:hypothetical protein